MDKNEKNDNLIKQPRNASRTRENILEAAKIHFSENSYETVGVRDIANDANGDAALVNRYFGTKENLFVEVVKEVFKAKENFPKNLDNIGELLTRQMIGKMQKGSCEKKFNLFPLLLRSAASPIAAPIVAEAMHNGFVLPFAKLIGGEDSELRAGLIISYVLGLSTMCFALKTPTIKPVDEEKIVKLLGSAIQNCVDVQ